MAAYPETTSRKLLALTRHGVLMAYILLVVLFAIAVAINPQFASWANIQAQLQIATFIGIIAIGQTLVILTGQIDLSVPWNLTFSAILMATLYADGYNVLIAIAAALLAGALVGVVNAIGVAIFRVHSLVWTLAVNALLQGAALVYTNAQPPKSNVPDVVRFLAIGHIGPVPAAPLVWGVLAVVTLVGLHYSRFGRNLYATGTNQVATFLSGIDTRKVHLGAFVGSGVCAAIAGILLTGYSSQTYLGMGNDYLLVPIAAVIIGGTNILGGSGGYLGTIAGAFIVVLLQSILSTAQIAQAGKNIIFGLIIVSLVLLYGRESRPTD